MKKYDFEKAVGGWGGAQLLQTVEITFVFNFFHVLFWDVVTEEFSELVSHKFFSVTQCRKDGFYIEMKIILDLKILVKFQHLFVIFSTSIIVKHSQSGCKPSLSIWLQCRLQQLCSAQVRGLRALGLVQSSRMH